MNIKAVWARFARTQVWRAWQRYGDRRGNRLAGATSFFGFLSLFPLIVLAAAVTGPLLGSAAVQSLKTALKTNLPGIGDKIDIDSLIANAGTIGVVSGISLLFTGLGWIDSLRASIRSMHELDDQPGNAVQLKLVDLGALVGLGLIGAVGTGASSILTGLSERIVAAADLDGTWLANWGLDLISLVLGIAAGALLFAYLQTALPRIALPRKVLLIAALAGGILFYLAQKLGNVYVKHVLGSNAAYGALALPLALLVWIYLMTRVIMLIAAWTKEAALDAEARAATDDARLRIAEAPLPPYEPLLPGPPGKRYKVVPIPQKKADTVAVTAGAVVGIALTTIAVQLTKAARSLRR
ncbi:YihY/virulence factor BrkB family protein [Kribbella sandramycini]|uniref:Membrane protein n=1 Tax=Kribbella sandramycini TaxID=60450 RepID=A0A7Y4L593_9ACTN|nr:YihY/virulence factor BrkB family protein [Kribbella sandramycini]MBB6566883.1 membrane protein [Kribbella sandramycini]NOL44605.1 YihY/virulence factor BrkB family protein [Kribbella sandramycini]